METNKAYLVGTKQGAYIVRALRRLFQYWPPRAEARRRAHGIGLDYYMCRNCGNYYLRRETHVDHVLPVVDPTVGIRSWDEYMIRLFCTVENLVVLCKGCHAKKTKQENKTRTRTRAKRLKGR